MKKNDLEQIIWDYIFNKTHDEDQLWEELEYLLHCQEKYCGYLPTELSDYWNEETKRYEFYDEFIPFVLRQWIEAKRNDYQTTRFLKVTPTVKRQLVQFYDKLMEKWLQK